MKNETPRYARPVIYLGQLAGRSPSAAPNSGTGHGLHASDGKKPEPKK